MNEEFYGLYQESRTNIAARIACHFNFTSNESKANSNFTRRGVTAQQKDYQLPGDLAALVRGAFGATPVSAASGQTELNFLTGLMGRNNTQVPGQGILETIQGLDPTDFSGASPLAGIMARNPYSTDYESAMQDLFQRQHAQMKARAISGPQNVRGAQDRQGLELGEIDSQQAMNQFREIRGQQDKEAGVVQQAVQIYNAIESMRRGNQMQAQGQQVQSEHSQTQESLGASNALQGRNAANTANLALAGELLGKPKQTTSESIRGFGNQTGASTQWGATTNPCCFIFLEALNGELPSYVRKGRDEFQTPARKKGYVWMASWLVPLMQKSKTCRWVVNWTMIKPFLVVGKGHKEQNPFSLKEVKTYVLVPICLGWFATWSLIGTLKKEDVCQVSGTI